MDPEIVAVVDNYHPSAILYALVKRYGAKRTADLLRGTVEEISKRDPVRTSRRRPVRTSRRR